MQLNILTLLIRSILCCSLILVANIGSAEIPKTPELQIIGLFKNKVIVIIDNKQLVLKIGDQTESGLTLIDANSKEAIFNYQGQKLKYGLSNKINSNYSGSKKAANDPKSAKKEQTLAQPDNNTVIPLNAEGKYIATVYINGTALDAIVDTGANIISMNSVQANMLNIKYKTGILSPIETASGKTQGYNVLLDEVRLGRIVRQKVMAVIIEGDFPPVVLLGMSFLQSLKMNFNEANKTLEISE